MGRRRLSLPLRPLTQLQVDFFERSEKTRERLLQPLWSLSALPEIAMPKLVRRGDYRGTHWPVFMRTLRPRKSIFPVDPQRKTHPLQSYTSN
jgi:hypothetical protein